MLNYIEGSWNTRHNNFFIAISATGKLLFLHAQSAIASVYVYKNESTISEAKIG